jgi:hypothetical protein
MYIRYRPSEPPPDLVAEDPKPSRPLQSDSASADNTASVAIHIRHRRLLDHVAPFWNADLERRVIQLTTFSPLHSRGCRFEYGPAHPSCVRTST